MLYINDKLKINRVKDGIRIECQILSIPKELIPKKKDVWSFSWLKVYRKDPETIYALIEKRSKKLHGIIQLIKDDGMLIMELVELAPFNLGSKREYENVAGCLIAFGCKESLKLNNAYKGYLTFISKSSLVELYKTKYFATQTLGTRMYIDPLSGEKLINKYLKS